MMKRTSFLFAIIILFALFLFGCANPGPYTLVNDESELPSISEEYSSKFSEIHTGMSLASLHELFPYLYVGDRKEDVIAYELVDYETYITKADMRSQNFWYGMGTPKHQTAKRILWFYFYDDKLVKWDEPHRWPDVSLARKIKEEMESVVQVTDINKAKTESTPEITPTQMTKKNGTCFAISENGMLVTAYHIVKGAQDIKVYLKQDTFQPAQILLFDAINDLAVLKIEASTPNFFEIAPMWSVQQGDQVFTVGFPTLSEGRYLNGFFGPLTNPLGASSLLEINIPVEPGNSGGPLVNSKGFVVGIITSVEALQFLHQNSLSLPENVNWAIKSDYLRLLINAPIPQEKQLTAEQIIKHAQMSTYPIEVE
ncbi:MAG: trypsin-like peptidase domain-containing protein [Sedimentisphaerales bacterium]|nr:trypsin-like peptidase domain-containing protein [Sedimentisphaerales bacterium]